MMAMQVLVPDERGCLVSPRAKAAHSLWPYRLPEAAASDVREKKGGA